MDKAELGRGEQLSLRGRGSVAAGREEVARGATGLMLVSICN